MPHRRPIEAWLISGRIQGTAPRPVRAEPVEVPVHPEPFEVPRRWRQGFDRLS